MDEILGQALQFFDAGFDTTANALTWFLYSMACNPEIQEKLHSEIMDVIGNEVQRTKERYRSTIRVISFPSNVHDQLGVNFFRTPWIMIKWGNYLIWNVACKKPCDFMPYHGKLCILTSNLDHKVPVYRGFYLPGTLQKLAQTVSKIGFHRSTFYSFTALMQTTFWHCLLAKSTLFDQKKLEN